MLAAKNSFKPIVGPALAELDCVELLFIGEGVLDEAFASLYIAQKVEVSLV